MPNKIEQIALKKKKREEDARKAEVDNFASTIAKEVLSAIKSLNSDERKVLEGTIAGLARSVAEAVSLSNDRASEELSGDFKKLVDAIKENKPEKFDNTPNIELFDRIGKTLASFESSLESLELSPEINLSSITKEELKIEVDRILEKLPSDSKREVTLAYERAGANKYINVRLTDGISFYKALGGGGGGGGSIAPLLEATSPTAKYGYCGKSETASYQYLFFEDSELNWYILRKDLTTNIVDYVKGEGGYTSVYDSPTTAPSPADGDYGSYGEIF